jgi:hypothetical protein
MMSVVDLRECHPQLINRVLVGDLPCPLPKLRSVAKWLMFQSILGREATPYALYPSYPASVDTQNRPVVDT